jgi:hypothetical protein
VQTHVGNIRLTAPAGNVTGGNGYENDISRFQMDLPLLRTVKKYPRSLQNQSHAEMRPGTILVVYSMIVLVVIFFRLEKNQVSCGCYVIHFAHLEKNDRIVPFFDIIAYVFLKINMVQ